MSQDQLRSVIDGIRAQMQSVLDAQLESLQRQQQEEIEAARRAAEVEAYEHWSVKLEQVRVDWASRLETELAAAAADADRRTVAECTRARLETEQAAAESIAQIRSQATAEVERAQAEAASAHTEANRIVAEERQRSEAAIAAIQIRVDDLERARAGERARAEALETEIGQLRAQLESDRRESSASLEAERERARRLEEELREARAGFEQERTATRAAFEQERSGMQAAFDRERTGMQAAFEQERTATRAAFEEERSAARAALDEERAAARADAQAQRETTAQDVTDARVHERHSQLAIVERLLDSVRAIGAARSLSDVLATLLAGAAGEVPRAALFVVNGEQLEGFRFSGFEESVATVRQSLSRAGALQEAAVGREPVSVTPANSPTFAMLPSDRAGLAVPLVVGGKAVAVLYADDVAAGEPAAPASWPEAVQILCGHASAALGHLTAVRTTQAMRMNATPKPPGPAGPSTVEGDEDQAARRYARLLVSEIKLYNEAAVRAGREKRDLLRRLEPEVERARRLYEERVPPAVVARRVYFQQELVQTLADGDPSLLGSPTVTS